MMEISHHQNMMHALAMRHKALLQLVGENTVQYLDIPVHDNVGDQLIYLGTLKFLRDNKIQTTAISSRHNYSRKDDNSTLLLHGGGNLGDLYIKHQLFREHIITKNHSKRIVIAPQSIHFEKQENFERARCIMSAHPDLHLCVRDNNSLKIARLLCENTLLLPDMAHQLYPIQSMHPPVHSGTLYLRRTDNETTHILDSTPLRPATYTDWSELVGPQKWRRMKRTRDLFKILGLAGLNKATTLSFSKWWERESNQLTNQAVDLFSAHKDVVTDRLHAHILACLMDMPSKVYDNTYGKNSSYIQAWTVGSPLTTLARN